MSFNKRSGGPKLLFALAVILRLSDHGLKPEFSFAIRTLHMNVHSRLFPREKVKPEAPIAKYCRAHSVNSVRCFPEEA